MIIKIYLVICLQTLRPVPILASTLLTGFLPHSQILKSLKHNHLKNLR